MHTQQFKDILHGMGIITMMCAHLTVYGHMCTHYGYKVKKEGKVYDNLPQLHAKESQNLGQVNIIAQLGMQDL